MKKGFTLIELLAVIVILGVISTIVVPIILGIVNGAKKEAFKNSAYAIIDASHLGFTDKELTGDSTSTVYTYEDGIEVRQKGNVEIIYNGAKPKTGVVIISDDGDVAIGIHDGKYCAIKGYDDSEVIVEEISTDDCRVVVISHDEWNFNKSVNTPELTEGLTPVIWNGTSWVTTTVSDPNWYSYDTTNKKWANARSNDGSFWVWIPRFAYRITTNYHTSNYGVVDIKFLMGNSNDSVDKTPIALAPNYSGSSQNNYVVHPGFIFGDQPLTGFWIAKFEATAAEGIANSGNACSSTNDNVTTKNIKIIPSTTSWRCISVSNAFTNSYDMQSSKDIYGWNDKNINTHLVKNMEWGATAYLAQSSYGKGANNIWINPNSNYTTGCVGTADEQNETPSCNIYSTVNGVKTSTTLNIYGVYDMSGGASEFTASYIDNNSVSVTDNGQSIAESSSKYKDVYTVGTTDTHINNYTATESKFGDGVYEMSTTSGMSTFSGWYADESYMPELSAPWFIRGGLFSGYETAGLFSFSHAGGGSSGDFGFRPVLLVGYNI